MLVLSSHLVLFASGHELELGTERAFILSRTVHSLFPRTTQAPKLWNLWLRNLLSIRILRLIRYKNNDKCWEIRETRTKFRDAPAAQLLEFLWSFPKRVFYASLMDPSWAPSAASAWFQLWKVVKGHILRTAGTSEAQKKLARHVGIPAPELG